MNYELNKTINVIIEIVKQDIIKMYNLKTISFYHQVEIMKFFKKLFTAYICNHPAINDKSIDYFNQQIANIFKNLIFDTKENFKLWFKELNKKLIDVFKDYLDTDFYIN